MSRAGADEFRIMLDGLAAGRELALATVVATSGSVYRRAGARMLIEAGGETFGSVSGGCLEADLVERARRLAPGMPPQVIEYDGVAEDGMPWGLGLGCNGRVAVVLRRLGSGDRGWLELVCAARAVRHPAALATVFGGAGIAPGVTLAVDAQGATAGIGDSATVLETPLRAVLAAGRTRIEHADAGGRSVLYEYLPPALQLWIVGAGPDAGPLAAAARGLGWTVRVVDHRAALMRPERFPGCTLDVGEPQQALAQLAADARTAIVVMTHNYERDRRALAALAGAAPAYLGVLGPRSRTERLRAELRARGCWPKLAAERLFAPVGLALGAETPEEIAVAIVAEIVAQVRGGPGGSLRDRDAPIHEPEPGQGV